MPTLTHLYEETNSKALTLAVTIAGHLLTPRPRRLSWSFQIGTAATLSFRIGQPAPAYLIEKQRVWLFVGFNGQTRIQFNGTIQSISHDENGIDVECVGQGKALDQPYKRTVTATDGVLSSNDLVQAIVTAAGLIAGDVFIDLPAWTPGAVLPQPLDFQSYSEAVLALAQPYGSPWYEMPSGQIRVELRDPIPSPSSWRTYFSGILGAGYSLGLPANITNAAALPRIRAAHTEKLLDDIRNKVIVRGAQLPQAGPEGESNFVLLEETADAPSPWLPTINGNEQFLDEIYSNPLMDDINVVIAMASRYLVLRNRLDEVLQLSVDGDPEAFLCGTVTVTDLSYSQANANYFVRGYTSTIDENDFSTEYDLIGGRAAGFSPRLNPFCNFVWGNRYSAIPFKIDKEAGNDSNKDQAASKVQQFVPADTGDPDMGEGIDGRMVLITFDASPSFDPDGRIVSYEWSDDQGHTHSGLRFTAAYNPDDAGTFNMTLIVTDDDGRTGTITHYVNINTFGPVDGYETGADSSAGGVFEVPTIFMAGEPYSSCSVDGGETINTLLQGSDGVVIGNYGATGDLIGIFWKNNFVFTTIDYCVSILFTAVLPYNVTDMAVSDDGTVLAAAGSHVYKSEDYGQTWELYGTPHRFADPAAAADIFKLDGSYAGGPGMNVDNGGGEYGALNIAVDERNWAVVEDNLGSSFQQGPILKGPAGGLLVAGHGPWYSLVAGVVYVFDPEGAGTWEAITPTGTPPTGVEDLWIEEGLDGVILYGGSDGLWKSIDGGLTAGPVFVPGVWGLPNIIHRIAVANVPQTVPGADLYAIVQPED